MSTTNPFPENHRRKQVKSSFIFFPDKTPLVKRGWFTTSPYQATRE